jgi:dTDP-D-glucose 4,6-dehydratase
MLVRIDKRIDRSIVLNYQVYGEALAADLVESAILDPTNPYSASKAAAEMIVKGYVKSHGLPAVVIRLNNVMGPHQVRVASQGVTKQHHQLTSLLVS